MNKPADESEALYVDREREELPQTGIFVRAIRVDGSERCYVDADIVQLDKVSLFKWLRSRGGANFWAECIVALILGHRDLIDTSKFSWLCAACGQENTDEDACCTQCHKLYESDVDEITD